MRCPHATPEERKEARKAWATNHMKKQTAAKVSLTSVKVYRSQEEADANMAESIDLTRIPTYDVEPEDLFYLPWTNGKNKVTAVMTFDPASQVHVFNNTDNLTNIRSCKPIWIN